MKTITILKGLPASGKTTYRRKLLAEHPGEYKAVNKDELRAMLDNGHWSKNNEKMVLELRDDIILKALDYGKHVIVDDTNFNPVHEMRIRHITEGMNVKIKFKDFNTKLETCIERDAQRENSVGEKVIREMYDKYLKPEPEVYFPPKDKPKAVIVDIDGTIAHMKGRSPYEGDKVDTDAVDWTITELVDRYRDTHKIIIMSGRSSEYRDKTIEWLKKNTISCDALYMRAEDDTREDSIIKRELFEENIRENYQVEFVLDDRNRVVNMWREIGLKCLQVADGDF